MTIALATTVNEAVTLLDRMPGATVVAGGTDLLVEANFGRHRMHPAIDITRIKECNRWRRQNGSIWLGAGLSYTRIIKELASMAPCLAAAARTVGSPQIRNRGTIGGNLATASPAGDMFPPLLVLDASVEIVSVHGTRTVSLDAFATGPKKSVLEPTELVRGVKFPPPPPIQFFAKIGTRNAMVIAVASLALAIDPARRHVRVAFGSAAPTARRAYEAEVFLARALDERQAWQSADELPGNVVGEFASLVAAAAQPVDDVRGSRAYRRHALNVLSTRLVGWALAERRK